jgi:hypothetical protein
MSRKDFKTEVDAYKYLVQLSEGLLEQAGLPQEVLGKYFTLKSMTLEKFIKLNEKSMSTSLSYSGHKISSKVDFESNKQRFPQSKISEIVPDKLTEFLEHLLKDVSSHLRLTAINLKNITFVKTFKKPNNLLGSRNHQDSKDFISFPTGIQYMNAKK